MDMTNTPQEQSSKPLRGKTILITGGARRIGLSLALAAANEGAGVVLHFNKSKADAERAGDEIQNLGVPFHLLQANLQDLEQSRRAISRAINMAGPLYGLVNNASIFEPVSFDSTTLDHWMENIAIHMTVPFLLCQDFAAALPADHTGRIINMLDWRALRPASDHFPYSVSKAGLAALTRSTAVALAPRISVNALALGAILPPEGEAMSETMIRNVPAKKWGSVTDVQEAFIFLMTGPAYITGEILHVDGGRHLI